MVAFQKLLQETVRVKRRKGEGDAVFDEGVGPEPEGLGDPGEEGEAAQLCCGQGASV